MKSNHKLARIIFILFGLLIINYGCQKENTELKYVEPLDENYISTILSERALKDSALNYDAHSPFNKDPKAKFSPLKYYEPTSEFIFKSKLFEYEPKDTVDVYGTRGELRRVIKYGFVILNYNREDYKENIYKGFSRQGQPYYSIWFTDKTTGNETYGVGRYIDFEKESDPDNIYRIDFNLAYNPYCAYSPEFTCPIPRVEDYIDIEIKAGEKNFH
ncbi:MAG: DUF1684 domain-containing protein [Ignavibacteria bacterium]|nr:DUF1684 domain-containing protein [Ignavibacteria bacterium]